MSPKVRLTTEYSKVASLILVPTQYHDWPCYLRHLGSFCLVIARTYIQL